MTEEIRLQGSASQLLAAAEDAEDDDDPVCGNDAPVPQDPEDEGEQAPPTPEQLSPEEK